MASMKYPKPGILVPWVKPETVASFGKLVVPNWKPEQRLVPGANAGFDEKRHYDCGRAAGSLSYWMDFHLLQYLNDCRNKRVTVAITHQDPTGNEFETLVTDMVAVNGFDLPQLVLETKIADSDQKVEPNYMLMWGSMILIIAPLVHGAPHVRHAEKWSTDPDDSHFMDIVRKYGLGLGVSRPAERVHESNQG